MLRSDDGTVEIRGRKLELMAEFSTLVNRLIKADVMDADEIDMCVDMAKKSDKELSEAVDKAVKEMFGFLM